MSQKPDMTKPRRQFQNVSACHLAMPAILRAALLHALPVLAAVVVSRADVQLPGILSDHMVLQRSERTCLWGKAAAGERVQATLGGATGAAEADSFGRWRLQLDLSKVGDGPWELVVEGRNRLVVQDVLVGEVWMASGQSNMAANLSGGPTVKEDMAVVSPDIRYATIFAPPEKKPLEDCKVQWVVASPDTVANFSGVAYHFARRVKEQCKVPVGILWNPCGGSPIEAWLSSEALDSTPEMRKIKLENWQKLEQKTAERDAAVKAMAKWVNEHPCKDMHFCDDSFAGGIGDGGGRVSLPTDGGPCGAVWFRKEVSLPESEVGSPLKIIWSLIHGLRNVYWNGEEVEKNKGVFFGAKKREITVVSADKIKPGKNYLAIRIFNPYSAATVKGSHQDLKLATLSMDKEWPLNGDWIKKVEYALPPPASPPPVIPEAPFVKGGASYLFNSRIAPIVQYTIKGILWYQGESNAGQADFYRNAFPLMIQDWRARWGLGDIPFYFCQLPNYGEKRFSPSDSCDWALLREAQDAALRLPNVKRAVLIDVGEGGDIHPRDKKPVGERLAAIALSRDYGIPGPFESPAFKSMRRDGDHVWISFDHIEGGLVAKPLGSEYLYKSATSDWRPLVRLGTGGTLEGFEIRGGDGKWYWADANIEGTEVVVRSAQVTMPQAVRYAWSDNPTCNLYNGAGFPASPFHAEDDFSTSQDQAKHSAPVSDP